MQRLVLDPSKPEAPLRDGTGVDNLPQTLPSAKETKVNPGNGRAGDENASIFFVGTATTILEWDGIRILTDPNFLHSGDHVHLGPGVTAKRVTNPAIDLDKLPRIDLILLSHYHADHFDQEVEAKLRRTLPIITTPHAKKCLQSKGEQESFENVYALDFFDSMMVDVTTQQQDGKQNAVPSVKVTGMPGKHVPPGPLSVANDLLNAVPPTNGWMVELGYTDARGDDESFKSGYRIYISGDTLMVDELRAIPERYKGQNIDLMLVHLGGTTIPSPSLPLLMVTMDAKQGIELVQLINPDVTIPIHYEYDCNVREAI